ncbi:radical SAM/SPASM domain-containing protein [Bacteroides acidifaciens]|uniref:radical SAM/SPASM domain-containing protein n=1 Tax=Bacteroides acidifaciens TaxID=85831 RepID=UPI0025583611|nr:SPASM domain-containing protein [Bacteroides acidifaciens]
MEKLRLSYYTIPVKLEIEDDKYLLTHGYTGAIDILDKDIWKEIEDFSKTSSLPEQTIAYLQKRGYLTTHTQEEEIEYVKKLAQLLHKTQSKLYKTFGFIISYDCNFRCSYCFENGISNHGNQWSKWTFTKEMVDKAYKTMMKIEPRKELHYKNILLYGGEPFLRQNKEVIEYIVLKGHQLGYTFKVISNGYDIDYFENILSPEYFSFFQITLDGDKENHNSRRFHYEEGASFDKIVNNIGILLRKNIDVSVRVNTDSNNFQDFKSLNELFKKLGFTSNPHFKTYSSILRKYNENDNCDVDINYLSMDTFNKQHQKTYNGEIYYQDFGIYRHYLSYLENGSRCRLYSASCSAQYGSYLLDPVGDIFTCLETVGKPDQVIGHYTNEEPEWTEVRKHWFERNTGNALNCQSCKYALLCGGGCLARSVHTKDGFKASACFKFKPVYPLSVNRAYSTYKQSLLLTTNSKIK